MRRFVSALARLALAASSLSFTPMCEAEAAPAPPQDCRVGFYRLQDGTGIDVGNTSSASLRWRRADGTSGALHGEPGKELTSTLGWTDRAVMATAFLLAIARRAKLSSMALRGVASTFDSRITVSKRRRDIGRTAHPAFRIATRAHRGTRHRSKTTRAQILRTAAPVSCRRNRRVCL